MGGPLVPGAASFMLDVERASAGETRLVNATVLGPGLVPAARNETLVATQSRTTWSPRVDAQRQEVQQVVEVDLPVPLGVGRQRQVDASELPGEVEVVHQALHADHIAVVHGCYGNRFGGRAECDKRKR